METAQRYPPLNRNPCCNERISDA